jgi:hypothetical protein
MKQLPILLVFTFLSQMSFAAPISTEERTLRLEATVEELTFKLAETLLENKRLTQALKGAMAATREGTRVVEGCDLKELEKIYAYSGGTGLNNFIRKYVAVCTKAQIKSIRDVHGRRTSTASNRLLDYYENL